MIKRAYGYAALTLFCAGIASVAQAELAPISDDAMGDVTGQAFMQVENIAGQNHDFTRMSLGIDVETRVNVDEVKVGELNAGTDFAAIHLALGHIARTNGEVYNGVTYNAGDDVHFEARRPYIELAEDAAGLAGFRMGFHEARGSVSSNTTSFSGNIGMKIESFGQVYDAQLFQGPGGAATDYRATHIGLKPNNPNQAVGCNVSGTLANCAPLTQLRSLDIGEDSGQEGVAAFTDGFFVGFQRDEGVAWQTLDGMSSVSVGKGVFINLPTNMTVNLEQLTGPGLDRRRTHQVDMGTKLF
ncbi:hypothetical protein DOQ08_01232 [Marinobacter litoralis]|uniref:Porin n=1 Tax=Marinobacter litoralis TaxID=187981 RepID=A0A3M2RF54_9GAMM|nr:hypothetical protein [Marinobacter litoralis]RMJ03912.1 hypothetical protein DOQ08_01232 [Marinobacter litoralis]